MDILPILTTLRRHKITAFLVILEIALTCAIICNAVFLISQRIERIHMPSGVAEHELIQIELASIGAKADEFARAQEDLAAIRQIPGVTQVASVAQVPFGSSSNNAGIRIDPNQPKSMIDASTYYGENLIETYGARLIAGRNLRADDYRSMDAVMEGVRSGDTKLFPATAIITQSMAKRLWPDQDALGKSIYIGKIPLQVVGILENLVRPSIEDDSTANYSAVIPIKLAQGQYVIRTAPGDRERVLKIALEKLKQNNPHRIVVQKRTWDEIRGNFFQNDRSMTGLLIGVCVALLLVTALGIVGLGSFWVAQRRRMIGVRRALGATRHDILHYFQTENFLLATIGIALGMVLAYGINLFLMTKYELPRLPATYFPIGAIALWIIGQLAVLGPAMRASMVPPVVATRSV
ncbi:FtsX-like permease family protein [Rhodanobacter sp. L36]|uniref:ABC transporter permease n=1 Tax=Rhodanobacter sp. L36 TaxID=1747221 RepID=UPI00131E52F8|nr:FtsX-like permease family protein [Rhodanobacter sp. L36]